MRGGSEKRREGVVSFLFFFGLRWIIKRLERLCSFFFFLTFLRVFLVSLLRQRERRRERLRERRKRERWREGERKCALILNKQTKPFFFSLCV